MKQRRAECAGLAVVFGSSKLRGFHPNVSDCSWPGHFQAARHMFPLTGSPVSQLRDVARDGLTEVAKLFRESLYGDEIFQGFTAEETIFEGKTPYQNVQIFATRRWGKVLVLDGIVQTTDKDEFIYHEMLTHVPMFACANPRTVMIVGGGDGGILREVLKHDIERVDMVEIDRTVVDICIEQMPAHNDAGRIYEDPRANLVIEDAFEFVKREKRRYDVIMVDSTDPVGAGEVLFSRTFYELCKNSLNPGGVLALQDGVIFLQPHEARGSMAGLRELGLKARCYLIAVPTYYGGNMTLGLASDDVAALTRDVDRLRRRYEASGVQTKHYTPELHAASFVLPKWMEEITGGLA
jgi:spermidine synthase